MNVLKQLFGLSLMMNLEIPFSTFPGDSPSMPRNQNINFSPDASRHPVDSPTPEHGDDDGTISPTFAQFAYTDGAVRKTRNRAYQKQTNRTDGAGDSGPIPTVPTTPLGRRGSVSAAGSRTLGQNSSTNSTSVKARASQAGTEAHTLSTKQGPYSSQHTNHQSGDTERSTMTLAPKNMRETVGIPTRKNGPSSKARVSLSQTNTKTPRQSTSEDPLTSSPLDRIQHARTAEFEDILAAFSLSPEKGHGELIQHKPKGIHPRPKTDDEVHPSQELPLLDNTVDLKKQEEIAAQRELDKRDQVIYGFPITLLTSPTRNWMPILDKNGLVYQAIKEIMTDAGLTKAVPMLVRRSSWKGKGKVHKPVKRFGRPRGGSSRKVQVEDPPDTFNAKEERARLIQGIIDLDDVLEGLEAAHPPGDTSSGITKDPVTGDEFVDVDVDLATIMAGTESIAFTSLGFYRITVREKIIKNNKQAQIQLDPKPSKTNWDPELSKINVAKNAPKTAPWSIRFLGYEWETVRTELLDESDDECGSTAHHGEDAHDSADLNGKNAWVTTLSGHRVLRSVGDLATTLAISSAATIAKGGWGTSGYGTIRPNIKNPGDTTGMPNLTLHPWGRDYIEPPPVGIYATQGTFEQKVHNWFPWAWETFNGEKKGRVVSGKSKAGAVPKSAKKGKRKGYVFVEEQLEEPQDEEEEGVDGEEDEGTWKPHHRGTGVSLTNGGGDYAAGGGGKGGYVPGYPRKKGRRE